MNLPAAHMSCGLTAAMPSSSSNVPGLGLGSMCQLPVSGGRTDAAALACAITGATDNAQAAAITLVRVHRRGLLCCLTMRGPLPGRTGSNKVRSGYRPIFCLRQPEKPAGS
jgi:hypothetical protein